MRWVAASLAILWAVPARAECGASPEHSAERAASDAPYDVPPAERCIPSGSDLGPRAGWMAPSDPLRDDTFRLGAAAVAVGGALLLTGASFALCARADGGANSKDFCHAAEAPLLVSGAAIAALGLGTLAVATWVLPERAPDGRASIAAGADLRLAWDFER